MHFLAPLKIIPVNQGNGGFVVFPRKCVWGGVGWMGGCIHHKQYHHKKDKRGKRTLMHVNLADMNLQPVLRH